MLQAVARGAAVRRWLRLAGNAMSPTLWRRSGCASRRQGSCWQLKSGRQLGCSWVACGSAQSPLMYPRASARGAGPAVTRPQQRGCTVGPWTAVGLPQQRGTVVPQRHAGRIRCSFWRCPPLPPTPKPRGKRGQGRQPRVRAKRPHAARPLAAAVAPVPQSSAGRLVFVDAVAGLDVCAPTVVAEAAAWPSPEA